MQQSLIRNMEKNVQFLIEKKSKEKRREKKTHELHGKIKVQELNCDLCSKNYNK